MTMKLVVMVEPFRESEHDGPDMRDEVHRDVVALEGPCTKASTLPLLCGLWTAAVNGPGPISCAMRRVGLAIKQGPLSVSRSTACGKTLPKRCWRRP